MKYRIAKELKKIFLIIYVIMMIISSYGLNKCSVIAANDSNGLNGVLFIGDSRLGGTVKSKLEAEGATVKQVDSSSPSSGWEEVCSSGSGTVRGRSNESISLPDKSGVTAVAVDLGVNDTNSFGSYKNVISNLKSRYPGVTIYAMSIYYCGTKRSGYSSLNSAIDTYNSNIKNYCSGNVKYADVNSGLHDGNKMKDAYQDGSGIHLAGSGIDVFVSNIKSKISGGSAEDSNKLTVEEARKTVSSWALTFHAEHGSRLTYSYASTPHLNRIEVHDLTDSDFETKINGSGTMCVDCVGWVGLAYRRALGIEMVTSRGGTRCIGGYRVTPQSHCSGDGGQYFKEISISAGDALAEGDILISNNKHVALYCGNNTVTEMWHSGLQKTTIYNGGDGYYHTYSAAAYQSVARLVNYDGATYDGVDGVPSAGGTYDTEEVNLDRVQSKLKYKGLPTTVTYSGSAEIPNVFELIKGLLDWIVGLLFLGLKIVVMGFTELFENIVSNLLHEVQEVKISS